MADRDVAKRTLVLGTHNKKKGRELLALLSPFGFELATLADVSNSLDVDETGETFAENAALKATEQARHLDQWVLGEDSGLCVDALRGAPGIYSARFSGAGANDESNNDKLLAELGDIPPSKRGAHYVCHAALSNPQGEIMARAEGRCYGKILSERHGDGGFGYDPLFEIAEYHKSFGQLGVSVKAAISHRSRAMRLLAPKIRQLVDAGRWGVE